MTAPRRVGGSHVDVSVLGGLVDDLGREHVAEVCALFLADARELVAALGTAVESGDADEAARVSHRLKSASGFLGAAGISRLCAEVERLAREDRLAEGRPRVDLLGAELDRVSAELAALVA